MLRARTTALSVCDVAASFCLGSCDNASRCLCDRGDGWGDERGYYSLQNCAQHQAFFPALCATSIFICVAILILIARELPKAKEAARRIFRLNVLGVVLQIASYIAVLIDDECQTPFWVLQSGALFMIYVLYVLLVDTFVRLYLAANLILAPSQVLPRLKIAYMILFSVPSIILLAVAAFAARSEAYMYNLLVTGALVAIQFINFTSFPVFLYLSSSMILIVKRQIETAKTQAHGNVAQLEHFLHRAIQTRSVLVVITIVATVGCTVVSIVTWVYRPPFLSSIITAAGSLTLPFAFFALQIMVSKLQARFYGNKLTSPMVA